MSTWNERKPKRVPDTPSGRRRTAAAGPGAVVAPWRQTHVPARRVTGDSDAGARVVNHVGARAERAGHEALVEQRAEPAGALPHEPHVVDGGERAAERLQVQVQVVSAVVVGRGRLAIHLVGRHGVARVQVAGAVGHEDVARVGQRVIRIRAVEDRQGELRIGAELLYAVAAGDVHGGGLHPAVLPVVAGATALEEHHEVPRAGVDVHGDAGGRTIGTTRIGEVQPGPLVRQRAEAGRHGYGVAIRGSGVNGRRYGNDDGRCHPLRRCAAIGGLDHATGACQRKKRCRQGRAGETTVLHAGACTHVARQCPLASKRRLPLELAPAAGATASQGPVHPWMAPHGCSLTG